MINKYNQNALLEAGFKEMYETLEYRDNTIFTDESKSLLEAFFGPTYRCLEKRGKRSCIEREFFVQLVLYLNF